MQQRPASSCSGDLLSLSLPFSVPPFPPFPPLPSSPGVSPLNPARGFGERCELPAVLGEALPPNALFPFWVENQQPTAYVYHNWNILNLHCTKISKWELLMILLNLGCPTISGHPFVKSLGLDRHQDTLLDRSLTLVRSAKLCHHSRGVLIDGAIPGFYLYSPPHLYW